MSMIAPPSQSRSLPVGMAALIAGLGLLAMAIIAPFANFGAIGGLLVPGDAVATAANLAGSETLFRLGAFGLVVVAVLDVIVAWALYHLFRHALPALALLGAWLRLAYAALFAAAITHLFSAAGAAAADPAQAGLLIGAFDDGWQAALFVFGLHLIVTGVLALRCGFIHWAFGALLIIAGLGYCVDSFVALVVPGALPELALYTFVGEVAFILWLLFAGRNLADSIPQTRA